ncbi:DUF190 domain-containing protein [Hephaestia mangrovi]|uniref:DUF190 domain-containing protein n=1 Tax=Hephaestia mangrovi TaxID=2873268 RepID=UPI001CA6CDB0|nr:DUF190 domain-containing protein [Hephaestia mangrovi]MBY8829637.1 DUF190 domain-containing protein [Hephaestia mangrovi]
MTMLLRLYTDENAHLGDRRLVDEIVRQARDAGLAGATVLRGRIGFGTRAGPIHQHHSLGVGDNMPMVVEIVDEEAPLRTFVAGLGGLRHIGLATLEHVEVLAIPATETGE